eukprot:11383-Heterococcus_DN1.PRE.4
MLLLLLCHSGLLSILSGSKKCDHDHTSTVCSMMCQQLLEHYCSSSSVRTLSCLARSHSAKHHTPLLHAAAAAKVLAAAVVVSVVVVVATVALHTASAGVAVDTQV